MEKKSYLDILHQLNLDENKYKKYENFINKHFNEIDNYYEKIIKNYNGEQNAYEKYDGINNFFDTFLKSCLSMYDEETIIIQQVDEIELYLNDNSYIQNNFDEFYELMRKNEQKEKENKSSEKVNKSIDPKQVASLTLEFLNSINPKLHDKFLEIFKNQQIEIVKDNSKSKYEPARKKIYWRIDNPTSINISNAKTLVHEFMHFVNFEQADRTNNEYAETISIIQEYLSIYYENAFNDFLQTKGIITKEECTKLKNERFKNQFEKDKNISNALIHLIKIKKDKGTINIDDINEVLKDYPDMTINTLTDKTLFSSELYSRIIYKFSTVLASETPNDKETLKNLQKLSPYIKNNTTDEICMEKRTEILGNFQPQPS